MLAGTTYGRLYALHARLVKRPPLPILTHPNPLPFLLHLLAEAWDLLDRPGGRSAHEHSRLGFLQSLGQRGSVGPSEALRGWSRSNHKNRKTRKNHKPNSNLRVVH